MWILGEFTALEPLIIPLQKGIVYQSQYSVTRGVPWVVSASSHTVEVLPLIVEQIVIGRASYIPKVQQLEPGKYQFNIILNGC